MAAWWREAPGSRLLGRFRWRGLEHRAPWLGPGSSGLGALVRSQLGEEAELRLGTRSLGATGAGVRKRCARESRASGWAHGSLAAAAGLLLERQQQRDLAVEEELGDGSGRDRQRLVRLEARSMEQGARVCVCVVAAGVCRVRCKLREREKKATS